MRTVGGKWEGIIDLSSPCQHAVTTLFCPYRYLTPLLPPASPLLPPLLPACYPPRIRTLAGGWRFGRGAGLTVVISRRGMRVAPGWGQGPRLC